MTDLYLHSMAEFSGIILPALELAEARTICEIGAEYGGMSMQLAEFTEKHHGRLISIDPAPKKMFLDWVNLTPHVEHVAHNSLEALDHVATADAWLIDGDHNWHTVYNELEKVDEICSREGKPLLIFMHDVGWPCAFRDLYYAPEDIPEEFRHPHSYEGGALPGQSNLAYGRGVTGAKHFAWALREGGPRNGVKTALVDFVAERSTERDDLAYVEIPAVLGLGILFSTTAPWSEKLADFLIPYHQNELLATLERNRLASYLRVIDLQVDLARRQTA
ncbi:hypothetical protein GCM10022253_16050 [Sphingomonas endophytica]|uniref:Class I SAM-dependent methyltransferase n=1 Tax=Sphingomonas endophytica TaxID=869719 RepID=A0ABR6N4D6_9SPHN|nr:class I SAM-dependent methyltransferase [Sphingomonas endophytica]MBB5725647.1 hypothetical protein [Sphingomonas endophytica]